MIKKIDYDSYARATADQVLSKFDTAITGLTDNQIAGLRARYGTNKLTYQKKTPLIVEAVRAYLTPFTLVLIALAVISFFTDYLNAAPQDRNLLGVLIILVLVFISGTMSLIQTVRSDQAAYQLESMVNSTVAVKRAGQILELSPDEVVCGNLIELSAGAMISADLRLLSSKDLSVSQAALTGESYPVEKRADVEITEAASETSYQNLVFMGSDVVSGTAEAIVISTGDRTVFGGVVKDLGAQPTPTNFETGVQQTSMLLIRFMALMAPTVIIINGFTKGDWLQALMFGLSVAVGLTPEMLPMIVTTNLVRGANRMSKKGTIIKHLNAIQNFGAIDVLCTDKTGTLTEDQIVLSSHLNCEGEVDDGVLRLAYLNSAHQTGLKNMLDLAIIDATKQHLSENQFSQLEATEKVDEIPFDFQRRRMSVAVRHQDGNVQLITKGAVDEILQVTDSVMFGKQVAPLTNENRAKLLTQVAHLNQQGLRVIAVAIKTFVDAPTPFTVVDETQMTLIGYLAFLDPPKASAREALQELKNYQVEVKVLTGDNELVTRAMCQKVGLEHSELITGEQLNSLDETQMAVAVERNQVFVQLNPQQKKQIMALLKENGHTVGFMGDGINDAPAMKTADVGISVDTAVDVAKDSADVILLHKDLAILATGLLVGRETFGNIMKYIKATTSSNFGNMLSVLCASIFLPFLPMLPVQLLLLNLIYDFACLSIPWDRMDSEYLQAPKKWTTNSIGKFMIWFGPTSSIFDISTYLLMYFVVCPGLLGGSYHTLTPQQQVLFVAIFHAGWFVESLWTQTLVLHALRTPKVPFIQSTASKAMLLASVLEIGVGSLLPITAFGHDIGLVSLPGSYWPWLMLTVIAYLVVVTFAKKWYLKKFTELL
ncbi:magnesium-importing ATPase [Lapidilactobacillus concavus DSM 17758]|uniref:Magnesium-transporting ATPase, P-type 1 n=1 Tax=Lapidilactobacillus concavus DSM 17758 TaxID=1423735 RepID=A0A0R1W643_9LACO|nr:magnesium-translocating P-type ATPase [Lapidilactobacillus concavus]KRM12930.1 magnesium-importing ATPase [Lapidilactobacillus concavus DSM 17758]GEL13181.1 magnesium-translocating P-type ATPase [Lapidilactobacillus concavus]